MQLDEQRLRFRDAMASLSAAVNVVTTAGEAGRCGITATAVCSVTDTPPSVMVCINVNSAMNPVFRGNGKLCINVLNHEQGNHGPSFRRDDRGDDGRAVCPQRLAAGRAPDSRC